MEIYMQKESQMNEISGLQEAISGLSKRVLQQQTQIATLSDKLSDSTRLVESLKSQVESITQVLAQKDKQHLNQY
jgi:archaellum component FlaC